MTITVANLPYSFAAAPLTAPKQGFMYKNPYDAFFYDSALGASQQITDINYPGYHTYSGMVLTSSGLVATATMPKKSISTLTAALNLATATTPAAHGLTTGDLVNIENAAGTALEISSLTQSAGVATALCTDHAFAVDSVVTISGAIPEDYNGSHIVTAATAGVSFAFALASSNTTTPATLITPAVPATDTNPAIAAVPIKATGLTSKLISTLTQVNGLATAATTAAHGYASGQAITVSGAATPTKVVDVSVIATTTVNGYPTTGGIPAIKLNFTTDPGMPVGTEVTITGSSYAPYNGDFKVVYVGTNFFVVNVPTLGGDLGASVASVKRKFSLYNGVKVITVTGASSFTFPIGASAEASIDPSAFVRTAADYTAYEGLKEVTVTSATTFTYWIAGTPPASAGGASITYQSPHGVGFGDTVVISGATPAAYNGSYSATAVSLYTFTYSFAGGTSPATGTIVVTGGQVTATGIVSLDSYYVVMSTKGKLFVSDSGYPTRWSGLNFNMVQQEVGAGVALGRSVNYVIALKEWSTEVYYDAGSSPGSPLAPVLNGFSKVGCASGDSLAEIEGNLLWIAQSKQRGRAVYAMVGLGQGAVSTPDVDRILALSDLSTVYAYGFKISGHSFYLLTLVDQNITLVLDLTTKLWSVWSSLTPTTARVITSVTIASGIATVVATAHGLLDGDPTIIAGCTPVTGTINGQQVVTLVDANTFKFPTTATGAVTLATPTSTGWTETYFKYTKYINALGKDLVQHESNGTLCELTDAAFSDVGNPVNVIIRTPIVDGGTTDKKFFGGLEVIGDKVVGTAYLRYSGKDYADPVNYRPVNLNAEKSRITRCGSDNRRSFELRYLGDTAFQVSALEIEIEGEQDGSVKAGGRHMG